MSFDWDKAELLQGTMQSHSDELNRIQSRIRQQHDKLRKLLVHWAEASEAQRREVVRTLLNIPVIAQPDAEDSYKKARLKGVNDFWYGIHNDLKSEANHLQFLTRL